MGAQLTIANGFEDAFGQVSTLVTQFRSNEQFYFSNAYQEIEARKDFIDKFFIALGWDVNHDVQKSLMSKKLKSNVTYRPVLQNGAQTIRLHLPRDFQTFISLPKQSALYANRQTPKAVSKQFGMVGATGIP